MHVVKTVIDAEGYLLYCSRVPIPFNGYADRGGPYYLQHIGIYGFRRDALKAFASMPATSLQMSEDLEQLKLLENGFKLYCITVETHAPGVDTVDDLRCVEDIVSSSNK